MNFYQELLTNYQELKQRQFRLDEGKNSLEAENKAKHYIQLAISHAGKAHYIVSIPELGSNSKIYVAQNGKQTGKVVIDNVISMYPMAIADGTGNPLRVPAYFQFVGKFNKLHQEANQVKPPEIEQTQMGMMPAPNPNTEGLVKAGTTLSKLAQEKKLFTLARSMTSPDWMNPGPTGDFQGIQSKIFGPDPFSLESKLNNATKVVTDPLTEIDIAVPLADTDKKLASDTFLTFVSKFEKLHRGSFTEADAIWTNQHIVNDKSGFWIKDPVLASQGISLSWRYSNSDPQHGFFRYLILSYNKLYKQWAAENDALANFPIMDINRDHSALEYKDLNHIRGKTAEELRVVVNSLANGDKDLALAELQRISSEYGIRLQQAYSLIIPYQEGYAAADSSIVQSMAAIKELESAAGNPDVIQGILPKLTWLEQNGILKRKPAQITLLGEVSMLGEVSDLEEYYPEDVASVLATVYKFTPEELKTFSNTNSLRIGLKTYSKRSPIKLSKRSLFNLTTSIMDYHTNPFVQEAAKAFNITPEQFINKTQKLEKISKLVNTVFSEITVPGYSSKAIQKSNVKLLMNKLWANSEYSDLHGLLNLENIDLSIPEQRDKAKSLFESRLILATLEANANDPEWKKYVSFLVYLHSGSRQNQILETRYLDSLETVINSHNHLLLGVLNDYVLGKSQFKKHSSSFSIIDSSTRATNLNLGFFNLPNRTESYLACSVPYNTLKKYNRV